MSDTIQAEKTGKLGFSFVRLPRKGDAFDIEQTKKMTDAFLESGGTYFDAANSYEGTEAALCESVIKRHPRGNVQIATKLPLELARTREGVKKLFETSLERLGTDYVDFYLLQGINYKDSRKFEQLGAWAYLAEQKAKGLIRHIGFSFRGTYEALNKILTAFPEAEFAQLHINFLDWDNSKIQSRRVYETARKHNIPIIVMGALKGGLLASETSPVAGLLRDADPRVSMASWAFRFAAQLDGVFVTLSGMSSLEQMTDNIATFKNLKTLSADEQAILDKAVGIINAAPRIDCSGCRHCMEDCPLDLRIPELISLYNYYTTYNTTINLDHDYSWLTRDTGKAGDCAGCRVCEGSCPKYIKIAEAIEKVSDLFD